MTNFYELEQKIETSIEKQEESNKSLTAKSIESDSRFFLELKKLLKKPDYRRITNTYPLVT
jgi:hypothetical protein